MKSETVKTYSFSMDFFKFGRGRKTLVILPGLSVQSVMLSADAIEKAYCSLENDFTIYVFDRRKELPPVYSIDDMANDTAEAMSAAGIGRACIFGASQGAMTAVIRAIYPQAAFENLHALLTKAARSVTREDLRRFVVLAGAARNFDATRELEMISCPTLIVGDTDDRIFGSGAAYAIIDRMKNNSDVELHLYNGYGHACYDTAPDFKERILRFLMKED